MLWRRTTLLRRSWVLGGTALATGALVLSACSGTSGTDERVATENQGDSQETTEQNAMTDPMRNAWAIPNMKGMVADGYHLTEGGVYTLIPTLLDYENGPDELLDKVKEVNDSFAKSEAVQQDLNTRIRQQFSSGPCTDKISTLAKRTDAIDKSNHDLVELNKTRLDAIASGQTWDKEQWTDYRKKVATWAADTFADEAGIDTDLETINQALAPKTGEGLVAICSNAAVASWNGFPENQYANEHPYFDKMLLLQSYFYNAQTIGINLVMSANFYRARELIRSAQNPIQMRLVGDQLCGEFQDSKETPLSRREACQFAKTAMETGQTSIRKQIELTGVGYSYNPAADPNQRANISALSPNLQLPPQIWVKDTTQYPNTGNDWNGSASHARKLVNKEYAGVKDWRGAGTGEWNALLQSLENRGEFKVGGQDRWVDATLVSRVGLGGFAGRGGDGNAAVIWMNEEVGAFGEGNKIEGWCLLIPYSIRGNHHWGGGRSSCPGFPDFLLPVQEAWQRATNQYLADNVQPNAWFKFAPARTSGGFPLAGGLHGFTENNDPWNPPSWVKQSDTWDLAFFKRQSINQTVDTRAEQVIFPIKPVGQEVCTQGQRAVNVSGVARMCGADNIAWLDAVITPLKTPPTPSPAP